MSISVNLAGFAYRVLKSPLPVLAVKEGGRVRVLGIHTNHHDQTVTLCHGVDPRAAYAAGARDQLAALRGSGHLIPVVPITMRDEPR